jgi:hypothetical protein
MQRRLSFAALILSCALVLASCQDVPTSTPDAPLFEIWDAVHGGGNEHFFWLPPMITPMPTYAGVFDGAADPTVQICEGAVSSCETPVITFSATAGLTVNALDEWYGADWYVFDQDPEVEVNDIFRISVLASGQELGFADLLIVDKVTGQLKNELDDEYILLSETQGRKFLKIRFRIEEGAITGRSPVLLYATGKIPSRIISVVDVTDLNAMTLLDWGISLDLLGRDVHGVDVDASDNVIFAGGWSQQPWFGVVDATLAIVGETTVSDGVLGDPLDVAFRSPEQAVACSRVAPGNLSRLLVFDVSDLANPVQTGASDIPGTGNVDGCRAIAFDEQGDLWVTTGGDGNLVRMTLDASGAPTSTQVTPLNYPWGVIEMGLPQSYQLRAHRCGRSGGPVDVRSLGHQRVRIGAGEPPGSGVFLGGRPVRGMLQLLRGDGRPEGHPGKLPGRAWGNRQCCHARRARGGSRSARCRRVRRHDGLPSDRAGATRRLRVLRTANWPVREPTRPRASPGALGAFACIYVATAAHPLGFPCLQLKQCPQGPPTVVRGGHVEEARAGSG